jgi:replicative DNA helicase
MVVDMENSVLVGCFKDKEYFSKVFSYLKVAHFVDVSNGILFNEMKAYVKEFNSQPSIKELGLKIKNASSIKDELKKLALEQLKTLAVDEPHNNRTFFLKETEKWIQKIELSHAIYKSVDIMKADLEFEPIVGLVSEALKITFDSDTGMSYNDSLAHRTDYYHRKLQGLTSGINSLDKLLGAGFLRKTLNVFSAPSHGGKTVALLNVAAANVLKGKNVLFVSLEMTEEEIAKRIDANILDLDINDFWKTPNKTFEEKFDAIKGNLGKLVIKEYPSGVFNTLKLESLLGELSKESSFTPDIICIDYLTLMASSRTTLGNSGNTYTYYKLIAEELHGFAKEFDSIIISGAQLNRGAYGNLEADMESIADSIGIIQTADTVIAMLTNDNLKSNQQMIFKTLKNRNTGRLETIMIQTDFPKMKFYDYDGTEQENNSSGFTLPLLGNSGLDTGGFSFD